jgi:hypothetical protein
MRTAGALLIFTFLARANDPLLWGGLEPGPYVVGFQSSIAFDGSRKYDRSEARPILLDVWYPASSTDTVGLAYATYLRVPDVSAHPWFRDRLERFTRDVVCDDLFHKKTESSLNTAERAAFDKLLATRTAAHLDAAAAPGRFPVVLYHAGAGGSFEENSLLFEYLASHGYVVVSSAFQSPYPESIGNNIGGIERSGPDLDFIAQQTRQWVNADPDKLTAIGHSAGAQNILQWIGAPKCPMRAFVSLDSTLEYDQFLRLHKLVRSAMGKLTPPRIPVLLIARAQMKPRFSAFDRYLRYSPHYEAEAAELSHDDFLTHGYLGRSLMQLPNAEAVCRSYEEVCRTARNFLDRSLRADSQASPPMKSSIPSSPVSIRYKAAR